MFQRLIHFIKYHNAFPIALSVILLSSGAVFAASPEAREAIISEETVVRSVDNSYIVNADLKNRDPQLQITSIEEDDEAYYVGYAYNTITITDYIWKGFRTNKVLTVYKGVLKDRDLGLYVAEEVNEIISREEEYLNDVQSIERGKGVTKKVATTEYSGLVGKMLSPKQEEFEGYVPVVPEKKIVVRTTADAPIDTQTTSSNTTVVTPGPSKEEIKILVQETVKELLAEAEGVAQANTASSTSTPTTTGDTTAPVITVAGNNPAEIAVGASYVDLGATVSDNENNNLGITYSVDGIEVPGIIIDSSTDATFIITYSATDQAGNTGTATRTVIVGTGVSETTAPEETTATTTPEVVVTDTTAPVITIIGSSTSSVEQNTNYTDLGATATDDIDGDITANIVTLNSVDTTTVGSYTVTYNVADQAGNIASEVVRTITVTAPLEVAVPPEDSTASTTSSS